MSPVQKNKTKKILLSGGASWLGKHKKKKAD
jgi:hypothetical protein